MRINTQLLLMLLFDTPVPLTRRLRLKCRRCFFLATQFSSDAERVPPLTFEGMGDERLDLIIWQRVAWLLMKEQDAEANSLLQEFNLTPLWDDPLE